MLLLGRLPRLCGSASFLTPDPPLRNPCRQAAFGDPAAERRRRARLRLAVHGPPAPGAPRPDVDGGDRCGHALVPRALPLIWNLATRKAAYVYETTTYEVKRRDGEGGLVVGVNHFVDPSWPLLPTRNAAAIADSELRHANLVALAEASKGAIDVGRMKAIVDTLVEDGGPTPKDTNIYRFVAVPQTLQWWIRVPEHVGWVHVDLRRRFRASAPRLSILTPGTIR